jgi:hypothetical protein
MGIYNDIIYVIDSGTNIIQAFDLVGKFIMAFNFKSAVNISNIFVKRIR